MLAKLAASGSSAAPLYVDDVFSAYTSTGNGSTQTITNGNDLATYGGMVWIKSRDTATSHAIFNTTRGVDKFLTTDTSNNENPTTGTLTTFNSNGFSLGSDASDGKVNTSPRTYVSWTFRNAPRFYTHSVVVKSSGSNATVDLSTLGTVGMVRVKRTDAAGSWYVWHRSLTAGKLLIGETTAAEATLGHITVSGTTLTLVNGVIADGTYLVEGFAHDTSADGIIQCFSYTGTSALNNVITLGWEPQYLHITRNTAGYDRAVFDTSRGMPNGTGVTAQLKTNTSEAEDNLTHYFDLKATGFDVGTSGAGTYNTSGVTYFVVAIRRPNKPPTSGTQVYNAIARTGTGAAATVTGAGFAPDLAATKSLVGIGYAFYDRLRGKAELMPWSTNTELAATTEVTAFGMDGASLGSSADSGRTNQNAVAYINHFFRRAPGVFDQVCTTGNGSNKTESHNLTVAPELWLHKGRSGATEWVWGSSLLANTEKIVMPSPAGRVTDATAWNSTYPTSSVISFGTAAAVNTAAATYTTYLWATLPGISKVGSYTGDGAAGKVIDCGFAAGARFVMILRTTASTSQDIFIWDTVRGIIAGNDPHLSLNTAAAEVTTDDSIDPDASGFAINQLAATNINVNGAEYIFLAYA